MLYFKSKYCEVSLEVEDFQMQKWKYCELSLKVEDFSNAKWRALYKTGGRLEVRLKYCEKAETKSKLIDKLLKLNVSRNKLEFEK